MTLAHALDEAEGSGIAPGDDSCQPLLDVYVVSLCNQAQQPCHPSQEDLILLISQTIG